MLRSVDAFIVLFAELLNKKTVEYRVLVCRKRFYHCVESWESLEA